MAREVRVRLSADVSAYIQAMGQAEQATNRTADAAGLAAFAGALARISAIPAVNELLEKILVAAG